MNRRHYGFVSNPARQGGAVLLVAVLLLLLAGVMSIYALNVGVFENRSTGNDLRSKAVNETAEAGLAQGFEFLVRQNSGMLDTQGLWERCSPADTTFPCGAVGGTDPGDDAAGAGDDQPRRGTMYRLKATTNAITDIPVQLSRHMLALANTFDNVGGFPVAYGVAPVLCRVKKPLATDTVVRCATDMSDATDQRIVTFVSVARMPGEAARTTLVQTIGQYSLLGDQRGKPPITASGLIDVTGNIQIVANANAAGAGVPVSVWTRKNVVKHGTPNTCYAEEFFRYGYKNASKAPTWYPDSSTGTLVCPDCNCAGDKSLSYDKSGNKQDEGMDILDIDGHTGVNRDVKPEEFPCDLFEYVFNVKAWRDTNGDFFCEERMPKVAFISPTTGMQVMLDVDEAYLYTNAKKVKPRDAAARALLRPGQEMAGNVSGSTSGIVWCQVDCGAWVEDYRG